ncbi:MAG: extracellular solute-binding protein [Parcubacteria group bacterium]|jgi:ABC-type glycerol-3-phosphate transport system substrate-binding protein
MKNKIRAFSALLAVVSVLFVSGCGCAPVVKKYKVNLEVWGVVDDSDAYVEIFKNYHDINPNVGTITYKKQRIETYQQDLLDALASGKGPDIFLIQNNWLPMFANKIVAAPKEILTEQRFRSNFVDVVADDFVSNGDVFAAPLSANSLALYYNKDLFNAAGIVAPPKTWDEFLSDTEKITKINSNGEISPSGASLGTNSGNINRATDILGMLMLQSKASMRDASGRVNFGRDQSAIKALEFYTNFAKSSAPNYSWNSRMHYSIDAFSEGTLAMMFNYSWQIPIIRSKAPKLNFAVASVPQMSLGSPVNYANYWGYAVTGNKIIVNDPKSKLLPVTNDMRVTEAWKLLTYLTTKEGIPAVASSSGISVVKKPVGNFDPAANYLERTKQPAARRDLIDTQRSDVDLGVFAQGNLIAKSWVENDPVAIEGFFDEMIDNINHGAMSVADAISVTADRIQRSELK